MGAAYEHVRPEMPPRADPSLSSHCGELLDANVVDNGVYRSFIRASCLQKTALPAGDVTAENSKERSGLAHLQSAEGLHSCGNLNKVQLMRLRPFFLCELPATGFIRSAMRLTGYFLCPART